MKSTKYWIKPFLIEIYFEWCFGIAIGYTTDKTFVIIMPFVVIEIDHIKVNG